jgi:ribosomal protein L37AE/L43A
MSHITEKTADAMDSAPCPHCDCNHNGIFSDRQNGHWHCYKCGRNFDGPKPIQYSQQRYWAVEQANTRAAMHIEDRLRQLWGEQP